MNILTGWDWVAERETKYKWKSLSGHFTLDIESAPKFQDYISCKIGLCLIRNRSKPITLRCIIMDILMEGTTYDVSWASDGVFDPAPRNYITKGSECKIFI